MAMQKAKSGLMAKYGAKLDNAVKKHGGDPTDYGMARIPPGITNGVAKLTECTFSQVAKGKQNEGEYYFRAAGVVVEPKSVVVNGMEVPVVGLQTSIMEMVCDTKTQAGKVTTQEEHIENILNEMRKLGAETQGASGADLEEIAAALKEAAPYFRFSTSQGKPTPQFPEPRIWENWYGVKGLENYSPPDESEGAVEDESEPVAESKSTSKKPAKKEFNEFEEEEETTEEEADEEETEEEEEKADEEEESDEEESEEDYESLTVDELLENATDDDENAQAELTRRAIENGASEGQVAKAKTWKAVAELARKEEEEEEPEAEEEESEEAEAPWAPEKEEIYAYRPVDPKTKKKSAKKVECEVVSVDPKGKTVTLKNLDNPKLTYQKVKWADLESA